MEKPMETYWKLRLERVRDSLEDNNFDAMVADSLGGAAELVMNGILEKSAAKSLSWGGSLTLVQTGLYDRLKDDSRFEVLDTYDKTISPEAMIERRRQSLLVDLFLTGTNAITEDGMLVNLDMIGNRVAAITFGPRHVVVIAGRNKIVEDLDDAMARVKAYAAPVNTMRLDKKTPCVKTGYCHDCKS
ncbi:MAG: lactate utilization protein, partial [Desulfobacterales bacterium]